MDKTTKSQFGGVRAEEPDGGIPVWKRFLDWGVILLAAPLFMPVMLGVYLLIKIVSPGPALFRQLRIGYRGRPFICFKFRTMSLNADTAVHEGHFANLVASRQPMKKLDASGDPRLIRCGSRLRAWGMDELPQVFNVLRGEMSMVGPRPCVPYEYHNYTPRHRSRFDVAPGLTGLWQVSGNNRTTFEEMIDLDIGYAQRRSLGLDLSIMLRTPVALLRQAREHRAGRKLAVRSELSGQVPQAVGSTGARGNGSVY